MRYAASILTCITTWRVSSFGVPSIWQRLLNVSGQERASVLLVTVFDRVKDAVPGMYVSLLYVMLMASTCQFGIGHCSARIPRDLVDEGRMRVVKTRSEAERRDKVLLSGILPRETW